MRFLLSFILSSILFVAPFQGNAGDVAAKSLSANKGNSTSAKKLTDQSIGDNHGLAIAPSGHRVNLVSQYRFYSFTNFINTVAFEANVASSYKTGHLIQPCSHCKRIGLQLIFPAHYFW